MMWTMNLLTALAALACVVSGEEEQVGKQGLKTFKVAVPSSTAPESDKDKRANQGDCYIPSEGIWRRHGETFTIGGNRCITYRCNYGQYNFAREACSVEGRCVQLNTEFDYGRCSRLRCVKNNRGSYVEYKFINVGNPKCEVNGVCYEFGQVFEVFCQSKRCVSNGNAGGFSIVNAGGYSSKCRDSNGRCWSQGEVFADWLNGRYYNHCVCNGGSGGYTCYNYGNGK